jgi:prepilin-type N-terminal cleavage/methylation domain-containing protein
MKHIEKGAGAEGGFSMIELIVVILILAILVSIAMLSVAFTRTRTREAACRTNLRTLLGMVKQYEVANDVTLPPDLDTLVASGYLRKMPKCVGLDYQYNSATGEVSCPNGHEL